MPPADGLIRLEAPLQLELRDASRREIVARLFEWDVPGETDAGPELIERGALDGVAPADVMLTLDHADPPIGRGVALELRDDGPYMAFRVARTARGDDALALATPDPETGAPALYRHVSVAFVSAPYSETRAIAGRRVGIRRTIDLRAVGMTWHPAHSGANILQVREGNPMPPEITPAEPVTPAPVPAQMGDLLERLMGRIEAIEERSRQIIAIPGMPATPAPHMGEWAQMALRLMSGERVPDLETRADLAAMITADNPGVIPTNIQTELIGIIDPIRRFLGSTRHVPAGTSGMELQFPVLKQRPKVDTQASELDELASQAVKIETVTYGPITKGGAGEMSMQLLKRSSPSFLNLWLELLAEAYAIEVDDAALNTLLDYSKDGQAVQDGGEFDPEHPVYGEAFRNAMAVGRTLIPDRIWLSTDAVADFIDAKTPAGGGGQAMYPGLAAIDTVNVGGPGGPMPIRLQPVWVAALDEAEVDVLIGPSRGFAWAEDGSYTLQADLPTRFGRQVGMAGILWLMPLYASAFTSYTLPAHS